VRRGFRPRAALAGAGSAALLLGALGFQYFGGLAPCVLCIWQRWPHGAAIAVALLALATGLRPLALLGALAVLAGAGIAGFHAGVEQGWWEGLSTCAGPDMAGMTADQFMTSLMTAPIARCDEIPWSFLGLSMAAWNGLLSLVLAGLWLRAYASSSASQ
jgi:disulfide bond formation protein DsbB